MPKCSICKNTLWYDSTEKCTHCGGTSFIGFRQCTKCKGGITPVRKPCPVCNPKGEMPDMQTIIR